MTKKLETVIISGAGPAGLTLAFKIFDTFPDLRLIDKKILGYSNFSRASGIQPRLFPILDELGILHKLKSEARLLKGNKVYVDGKLVTQVEFKDEKSGEYPLTIDQFHLEQLIISNLIERGLVIEEQKEVTELILDKSKYNLKIRNYKLDTDEIAEADLIVACDGSNSKIRKLSGIGFSGFTYLENSFVSDCQFTNAIDYEYMHYHTSQDLRLVIVPLPGNNCFKVSGCTYLNRKEEPEAVITNLFKLMLNETPAKLDIKSFSYYKINARIAEKFTQKNLFLCGDSAHVFPPNGGQGLNCAMENAYYLGSLLQEGLSLTALKQHYSKRRSNALHMRQQTTNTKTRYTRENISSINANEEANRVQKEEL